MKELPVSTIAYTPWSDGYFVNEIGLPANVKPSYSTYQYIGKVKGTKVKSPSKYSGSYPPITISDLGSFLVSSLSVK
jgi:hypothetical protein